MQAEATFADLIRLVRSGDEAAAAELVRRYEPEVRREVRMKLRLRDSRLRRAFDSMDVVQSVLQSFFLRAAAGQYDLDEPGQLCGLLVAMARNKLAEHVRYQQRERRDVRRVEGEAVDGLVGAGTDPTPSRVVAGRDLLRAFRDRLSAEERQAADLRAEGKSWADVASEMGGTPEARRKQLSRAVDRVTVELGLIDPGAEG